MSLPNGPEVSVISPTSDSLNTILDDLQQLEALPSVEVTPVSSVDFSQFSSLIDVGGPVVVVLIMMSIVAMSIFFLKYSQFFLLGLNRQKDISQALACWHRQDAKNALKYLGKTKNPIARVLEAAISLKNNRNNDDVLIREEVLRVAKRQLAKAKSYHRILEVIATLSPLLGLLGTVLGMITAFQSLQNAGATVDPSILSGGIWKALLTTAVGLIVAIPTVLAVNWLEQKVENLKLNMEDAMTQIFTSSLLQAPKKEVPQLSDVNETEKASAYA